MSATQQKLSEILAEQKFVNVVGCHEWDKSSQTCVPIQAGKSLTWDRNQGLISAYDEKGEPWVRGTYSYLMPKRGRILFIGDSKLRKGAHVPFSNGDNFGVCLRVRAMLLDSHYGRLNLADERLVAEHTDNELEVSCFSCIVEAGRVIMLADEMAKKATLVTREASQARERRHSRGWPWSEM